MRRFVVVLLAVCLLASMVFGSLPLVKADYTVDHASFPPDLPGDISGDGVVGLKDVVYLARIYGSTFGSASWNPTCDLNDDGKIGLADLNLLAKAYGKKYETSVTPIAYSTSFEFQVPDDGNASVWYYILVRFYVTDALSGKVFYLVAGKSVDDAIRNVKVDCCVKSSQVGGLFSVELGQLSSGYHLLELEYLENIGGGLINFTVKTAADEYAWMDRFRIYVPNYSDAEVKYTVKTYTCFPGDTFFLGGSANQHLYVDDYIDDVYLDAGLLWQDWMWNLGSYGSIYAWQDGFLYPLGWQNGWHTIKFTYGEIWGPGLLDFQYISRTNQRDKIGKPKYLASAKIYNLGDGITLNSAKIYGTSQWASDPGVSGRNFTILTTFNVTYNDGSTWFNTLFTIEIGNWWATWELGGGQPPDVAIPLNFTAAELSSNLETGYWWSPAGDRWFYWEAYLRNYKINVYSFQNLPIKGIEEAGTSQSKNIIAPDYTIESNFLANVIMTVSAFIEGPGAVIGAAIGLGIAGAAADFSYVQGQSVSRYIETVKENNYLQLTANEPICFTKETNSSVSDSKSDIVFIKFGPNAGYRCGLTKVVLEATLGMEYHMESSYTSPIITDYPIGTVEITLYIPWFIFSVT